MEAVLILVGVVITAATQFVLGIWRGSKSHKAETRSQAFQELVSVIESQNSHIEMQNKQVEALVKEVMYMKTRVNALTIEVKRLGGDPYSV